jgi:hypothetical protein
MVVWFSTPSHYIHLFTLPIKQVSATHGPQIYLRYCWKFVHSIVLFLGGTLIKINLKIKLIVKIQMFISWRLNEFVHVVVPMSRSVACVAAFSYSLGVVFVVGAWRLSSEHWDDKKSTVFWDMTPCSPLKVNRRFGGTYRLHFQGRRINQTRNQRSSGTSVDF